MDIKINLKKYPFYSMCKLNKICGFVALPVIIGGAVLAVGVLGGLAYEYKNNRSIISIENRNGMPAQLSNLFGVDKNKMLAQVSGVTTPTITAISPISPNGDYNFSIPVGGIRTLLIRWSWANLQVGDQVIVNISKYTRYSESKTAGSIARVYAGTVQSGGLIEGAASELGILYNLSSSAINPAIFLPTYYVVEALVYRSSTSAIASDISDDHPFTITVPTQSSSVLKVISPNGGESLVSGTTQRITWLSDLDSNSPLDIYLMNNADNALLIKSGIAPKPEFFDWNILDTFLSSNYPSYKIVIVQKDRHIKDYSDDYFTISAPNSIVTCTDSNGGQANIYKKGSATGLQRETPYITTPLTRTDSCAGYELGRGLYSLVYENWCEDGYLAGHLVDCPSGYACKDGVCVTTPSQQISFLLMSSKVSPATSITISSGSAVSFVLSFLNSLNILPEGSSYNIHFKCSGVNGRDTSDKATNICTNDFVRNSDGTANTNGGFNYPAVFNTISNSLPGEVDAQLFILDQSGQEKYKSQPITVKVLPPTTTCVGENVRTSSGKCCSGLVKDPEEYADHIGGGSAGYFRCINCPSFMPPLCKSNEILVSGEKDANSCLGPGKCVLRSCDATSKAIVDSVGGCSKIDQSLYSNVYQACCVKVTKETLLSLLNNALADGIIDASEKTNLLTALNSYLQ